MSKHFLSRQAVSLHVKILDECGAISIRQKGRERYCVLEPKKIAEAADWFDQFKIHWDSKLKQLDEIFHKAKS